jgi:hypothetical protein
MGHDLRNRLVERHHAGINKLQDEYANTGLDREAPL